MVSNSAANMIRIADLEFRYSQGDFELESPTGTAPDRYIYYPGTEPLKSDEIRNPDHVRPDPEE